MNGKSYWYSMCVVMVCVFLCASPQLTAEPQGNVAALSKIRADIYAEMQATLGLVPTFMKSIPDSTLGLEWELMKRVQMALGPIPNKYRELIGVAVAAATKCEYCVYFHTEFARLNGATDAEIEDALHYAKSTTGWSTYINGSQADIETFKGEVRAIVKFVKEQEANKKEKIESITGKNFDKPDETKRPFEKGKIEVITVGGLKFYRETLEPGWRWSTQVKPVVGGESCQKSHVKIFLSGRQRIRMNDGTEMEFGPGDVAIMQPGHDAWVVGNEPNVLIELSDAVTRQK